MNRLLATIVGLTLSAATAFAQAPAANRVMAGAVKPVTAPLVEFEMMRLNGTVGLPGSQPTCNLSATR
jgi:hypothetical protein